MMGVEVCLLPDWAAQRRGMVNTQLLGRGIRDARVLRAMGEIPREEFVPAGLRPMSYQDDPVPLGDAQTISQPYMTALMAQELELTGTETVLEVGAGSGYAAAVLGALARRVVSIDIVPAMAQLARQNLRRTARDGNVTVLEGDGSLGCAEMAPFDAISVAAGTLEVPAALLDQLGDPGRMVIPVGPRDDQELRVVLKSGGRVESRFSTLCRFVPLRGGEGWS